MYNARKFYKLDDSAQGQKNYAEEILLESLLKYDFESIFEVGCGDGHFLRNFPRKLRKGVEISKKMIDQAGEDVSKFILEGDITDFQISKNLDCRFDCIVAHYVFTELTRNELSSTFSNVKKLLRPEGHLYFTITDPRYRADGKEYDGYKIVFEEPFSLEKCDIPFKVLLREENGNYVDVGIRDYHNSLKIYDQLLIKAGFSNLIKTEIKRPNDLESFAVLYEVR
ncbi:class I SAM-dependent methyltransferase [Candidatus Pacearchaeota archaeon]|nr:class I SAM-dependent methyltransferase [Candidatus Pacearchaeota archaeon]